MDRQLERGLFGNDSALQSRTEGRTQERPVGEQARQLDDKPLNANAKKKTSVTIKGLRAILEKQQYRCALSGVALSPDCANLDHIIPLSKGGKHEIENVQIVHPVVNALKGMRSQDDFMTWVQLIASNREPEIDQEW